MDPITIGRVLLIWMLLSLTLGNCALFKSWVHNIFLHNDSSIGFHLLLECNDTISKQTFGFYYHGPKCKYTFDHINFVNKIPSHNKGFKPLYKVLPICSLWSIYVAILSVISIFIFLISFTPSENSLMASLIVKESASNFLLLFSIFLLALPCTLSNLQALVLGVSEPIDGASTSSSFPWPRIGACCGGLEWSWVPCVTSSSFTSKVWT